MKVPKIEDIPVSFFKYRPLENKSDQLDWLLETICAGRMYWPSPNQFNDPFDCVPNYEMPNGPDLTSLIQRLHRENQPDANRQERRKFIRSSKGINPKQFAIEFRDKMNAHLRDTALYSLAVVPDNILMWSHYANAHQGVCLRFNGRKFVEKFVTGYPVTYVSDRPTIRIGFDPPLDVLGKLILNKADIWAYEEEWRFIDYNGKAGLRQLSPQTLNGVVLRCRIQSAAESAITEAIGRQTTPPALYKAVCDTDHFKVQLEPLNEKAALENSAKG